VACYVVLHGDIPRNISLCFKTDDGLVATVQKERTSVMVIIPTRKEEEAFGKHSGASN
jgi:hypothetical protein